MVIHDNHFFKHDKQEDDDNNDRFEPARVIVAVGHQVHIDVARPGRVTAPEAALWADQIFIIQTMRLGQGNELAKYQDVSRL